jgi:phospholipid/cholesterol/gamma-HCH transport system substrate-binding protein
MKRAIKNHLSDFIAILVLVVLAIAVTGYILHNEGLRFPWIQSSPFTVNAEFSTAQAVTPGQGQTVRVSGVQIGTISGVTLKNGLAIVKMGIDQKYKHLIHTNATAFLRPKTGLQDIFVELNPGGGGGSDPPGAPAPNGGSATVGGSAPVVKAGYTIPLSQTAPEVNVDEILSSVDADTRQYLQLLVNGAGQGLNGRGGELAQVLQRFEPTHQDLARLNTAVAARGAELAHLVNALKRLNNALAAKQGEIGSLVVSSSQVFRALASENQNISRSIVDLPPALQQTRATLAQVQTFAQLLGPTATKLIPAAQALPAANKALVALAKPSTPIIKNQIRPFVVASRPLVRNLEPASINLANATPNLINTFTVVNHFLNLIGYNPPLPQHGYLWWLAWLGHIGRTVFAVQDGNGDFRQAFIQASCATLGQLLNGLPLGGAILAGLNLDTILADLNLCPPQAAAVQKQFQSFKAQGSTSQYSTANPAVQSQLRKSGIGNVGNQFLPHVPTGGSSAPAH